MAETMLEAMEEFAERGFFTCPECGNNLEIDADQCCCGWANAFQI